MRKIAPAMVAATLAALVLLTASAMAGHNVRRAPVSGTDDWPADSTLEMGTFECPGTEPIWSGAFPMCPEGSRARIRGSAAYSCVTGLDDAGTPEPRLTGVGYFVVNGNFDPNYSGEVWGTWKLVLAETCDPALLDEADRPFWEGTWQGTRTRICEGEICVWIGVLKVTAHGRGGPIDRALFKGTEIVTTLTPLPVPYELIPGFCPPGEPCPPEGVVQGAITTRPHR